jgi:hypothetical protein
MPAAEAALSRLVAMKVDLSSSDLSVYCESPAGATLAD